MPGEPNFVPSQAFLASPKYADPERVLQFPKTVRRLAWATRCPSLRVPAR